jgi:hypothetical protein
MAILHYFTKQIFDLRYTATVLAGAGIVPPPALRRSAAPKLIR